MVIAILRQLLRQTPTKVWMLVFRDEDQYREEELYDTFQVILNKPNDRGLGLSIVGKRNDVGVFISDVVSFTIRFDNQSLVSANN